MLWFGTRPAEPVEVKPGVKNRIISRTRRWFVIHKRRKNTISSDRDTFCVEMHEFWLQLCLKCSWTVKTELPSKWYITRAESVQVKLVYQNMHSGISNQTFRAYANCCSDAYKPTHYTYIQKEWYIKQATKSQAEECCLVTFTSCTAVEEKSQQYTISPGSLQL